MWWETRTGRAKRLTFTWPAAWKEFTSGNKGGGGQVPALFTWAKSYAAPTAPEHFLPGPAASWGRPAELAEPTPGALGIPLPAGPAPRDPGTELIATQRNTNAPGASASWSPRSSARPFLRRVQAPSFPKSLRVPERPPRCAVSVSWHLARRTRPPRNAGCYREDKGGRGRSPQATEGHLQGAEARSIPPQTSALPHSLQG